MDRCRTWTARLGLFVALGGAVASRDACLGGARRPDPEPLPAATATAAPGAQPAPTSTFATPP